MNSGIWAQAVQIIALLAIPHAAAQAVSKFVSVSNRPSLTAAAKTMEAAAYATLAVISAIILRSYLSMPQQHLSDEDIEHAREALTLGMAIQVYVTVYILALIGIGAVVISLKVALHTERPRRLKNSLWALGILMGLSWIAILETINRTVGGIVPSRPLVVLLVLFGPPLLVVVGVFGVRIWDQKRRVG